MITIGWSYFQSASNKPVKFVYLEGLAILIGSHLTREPTASPVLTKCWKSELMLSTNFGSLCQKVTKVGSQNFGNQIWFCTRLLGFFNRSCIQDFGTGPWLLQRTFNYLWHLNCWRMIYNYYQDSLMIKDFFYLFFFWGGVHYMRPFSWCFESWCPIYWT